MPAPRTIDVRLGRYEIVRRLVRGELAELWLARNPQLDRHVVIKQVRSSDPQLLQRFMTEARIAGSVHHQNIVQVEEIGEDRGHYYLTMEYVHGESLRRILARLHECQQQLPLPQVLAIIGAVASALHHAHAVRGAEKPPAGIAPGNILVGYDGHVKVCDLGIARAIQPASKGRSVPYMSPEECTGEPVDRRADVFALGVLLYEAVVGRRLFKSSSELETKSLIAHGIVPRPSCYRKDLPPALEAVIMKALARAPVQRFQTADELRFALEPIAAKHANKMTPSALAAYMQQLFEPRPEPWLDTKELVVAPLDFDGTASGVAVPRPVEEIENRREPTAIVALLPIEGTIHSPHKLGRRRRLIILAASSIVAMAGVLVVVAMTGSTPPPAPQVATETVHAKPAPPKDPTPPPEPAAIPWEKRTWANTEAANAAAPPAEPPPTPAPLPAQAEPAPTPTPTAPEAVAERAPLPSKHKSMARTTRPAAKSAVKQRAKPKSWDPNALFYGRPTAR